MLNTYLDRIEEDETVRDLRRRLGERSVLELLAGVSVFALVVRLVLLGARVAHFDEGRVAYWAVYYQETGNIKYEYIVHGPFIQHVNRWLFEVLPATDFTMRLPIAVIGAALPLSAYLFREHLDRREMVGMGVFLAINPLLLYYTRFMRSDPLLAGFMFFAFGCLVRYYDTRQHRYLYAAMALSGLGFASKENAVVYVITWAGALAVLLVQTLILHPSAPSALELVRRKYRHARHLVQGSPTWVADRVIDYSFHVVFATLLLGVVVLFFYSPRGTGIIEIYPPDQTPEERLAFWEAVAQPSLLPDLVSAVQADIMDGMDYWFGQSEEVDRETYLEHAGVFWQAMLTKGAPLFVFGVLGFLIEWSRSTALERKVSWILGRDLGEVGPAVRRRLSSLAGGDPDPAVPDGATKVVGATTTRPRNVVLFSSYAGFASIVGYPFGMDIAAAWVVIHAFVPLSIPAGVGLAKVYEWGADARVVRDDVSVGVSTALVVFVVLFAGVVAGTSVYANHSSPDNALVQFAQPGAEMKEPLQTVGAIADENQGAVDLVAYYGEQGSAYSDSAVVKNESESWEDPATWGWPKKEIQPMCIKLAKGAPLHWYFTKDDVNVACERTRGGLESRLAEDPPPVILTQEIDDSAPRSRLAQEYTGHTAPLRAHESEFQSRQMTFWIHDDWRDAGS